MPYFYIFLMISPNFILISEITVLRYEPNQSKSHFEPFAKVGHPVETKKTPNWDPPPPARNTQISALGNCAQTTVRNWQLVTRYGNVIPLERDDFPIEQPVYSIVDTVWPCARGVLGRPDVIGTQATRGTVLYAVTHSLPCLHHVHKRSVKCIHTCLHCLRSDLCPYRALSAQRDLFGNTLSVPAGQYT